MSPPNSRRMRPCAADTVLFTVPNQLGVAYNARILDTIARYIAPAIGWTPADAAAAA